ncbi:MAG: glycerophosphodiester phosphodiesterase [Oscillospiraceae bacterium]|nr:glycerophosphodiester phosphodiesterase [Oscillospiraceae bacterium]
MYWIIILIVIIIGLPFLFLAPGHASKTMKAPFYGRNFAHRGLHSEDKSVPENSLAAFRLAVEAGYGMELDVQLSKDGEVVVFHDDDLKRVCGVDARVDELDYSELSKLRLCGTEERIPLFSEVLDTVNGKTPMIVELKTGKRNKELCLKTLDMLNAYGGDACIESFDPFIVTWFAHHAPKLLRGQLSQRTKDFREGGLKPATAFILGNVLFNVLARPHFIAYRIGERPLPVRFSEALGAMPVGWTSHDPASEKRRDAVIFEFYRPEIRYK